MEGEKDPQAAELLNVVERLKEETYEGKES